MLDKIFARYNFILSSLNWLKISLIICFSLIFNCNNVKAGFGSSCALLPTYFSDKELEENTAYGYLLDNIDMKNHISGACSSDGELLKFCLHRPSGGEKICDIVSLSIGQSKIIKEISSDSLLQNNDIIGNIRLTAQRIEGLVCLTMPTSRGPMPIVCRDGINGDSSDDFSRFGEPQDSCKNISPVCYGQTVYSQSLFNFTGNAVLCLKESLENVFYRGSSCNSSSYKNLHSLTSFSAFHTKFRTLITVILVLYCIFYAIKTALKASDAKMSDLANFLLRLGVIIYFAYGAQTGYMRKGQLTYPNAVTDYALPALTAAVPAFANIIFQAAGSQGLCSFDESKYKNDYGFYSLWDSIDCRIGYYFGMSFMYNMDFAGASNVKTPIKDNRAAGPASLKEQGNLAFFTVLLGFVLAGNIIIVACGLVFAIFFLSILLYFFTSYVVCLMTLYVMAYISPIIIVMFIAEKGSILRGYFDSFLKIILSCTFQPAIIAGFLALLLTMYDSAIFGSCEFQRHDYEASQRSFSTFELVLPEYNQQDCINSAGYKLLSYYNGYGWGKYNLILFEIYRIKDVLSLGVNLIYVLFFSVIFYYFSSSISRFAASLTEGPSMSAVTAAPTMLIDAAINGAKKLNDWMKNSNQTNNDNKNSEGYSPRRAGPQNAGNEAQDKTSTGSNSSSSGGSSEASDKASTG